jgi:hypothetical protein
MGWRATRHLIAARSAIGEVISRYGVAVDGRDNALYRTCFWPDATFMTTGRTMRGKEFLDPAQRAARAPIRELTGGPTGLDTLLASSHVMGATATEVAGSTAITRTTCVAILHGERDGVAASLIRGVAYDDRFECRGGEWRIIERVHSAHWMGDAAVSPLQGS